MCCDSGYIWLMILENSWAICSMRKQLGKICLVAEIINMENVYRDQATFTNEGKCGARQSEKIIIKAKQKIGKIIGVFEKQFGVLSTANGI